MLASKKAAALAFALGLALAAAGCRDDDLFSAAPGIYKGFVAVKEGRKGKHALVAAQIKKTAKDTLELTVKTARGDGGWSWTLKARKKNRVSLSGAELKKSSDFCFFGKSGEAPARLCFDRNELSIELGAKAGLPPVSGSAITSFTMIVDRVDDNNTRMPTYEKPAAYTLDKLMALASAQGFETRAEFERVMAAKQNAKLAADMLYPHISFNSIFGAASAGVSSLSPLAGLIALHRAVGDLIPFAFKARRIKRDIARDEALVERDSLTIMRADAVNVVQGLGYAINRDRQILAKFESNIASITRIRDAIIEKERSHLLIGGSSDDITAIINSLEQGRSVLARLLEEEYSAVGQAAGFFNPKAVTVVEQTEREIGLRDLEEIDAEATLDVALQRSYEIRQLDTMLDAARLERRSRGWFTGFFDPAADPAAALGYNHYAYVEVSRAKIRELVARREGLESLIARKVDMTLGQIGQSLESYRLATEAVAIQARRVNRILTSLDLGVSFFLPELVSALQDQVRSEIEVINARAAYAVARAQLDRLLFIGPYGALEEPVPAETKKGGRP